MRIIGRDIMIEALEHLTLLFIISISFSYFTARFYLRLQNPIEAFLGVMILSFLIGFISRRRTLVQDFYISILSFLFSRVLISAISAYVLIYPFIVPGVNMFPTFSRLFVRLLEFATIHLFFSTGMGFTLIGKIFSPR